MVAEKSGIPIADFEGEPGTEPRFDLSSVSFNGVGEMGHESFIIFQDNKGFNFCKTNHKPYDALVTACLILADYHFGDSFKISSDGSYTDWEPGLFLVLSVFPKTHGRIPIPFKEK